MKKTIILWVAIFFIAGCSSTGNMGMVIKSQANPGSLLTSSYSFKEIGLVKGRACRFFLLGVVPWGDSTVTQAIDNALANGGDALINISVTNSLYDSFQFITSSATPAQMLRVLQSKLKPNRINGTRDRPSGVCI